MTFEDIAQRFGLASDQLGALSSISVDLTALVASAKKDEDRMVLFVLAVARKEAQYASEVALLVGRNLEEAKDVATEARVFSKQAGDLVGQWLSVASSSWKKLSFARLFGWDPFREMRQKTRAFAARWDLDPAFRSVLG